MPAKDPSDSGLDNDDSSSAHTTPLDSNGDHAHHDVTDDATPTAAKQGNVNKAFDGDDPGDAPPPGTPTRRRGSHPKGKVEPVYITVESEAGGLEKMEVKAEGDQNFDQFEAVKKEGWNPGPRGSIAHLSESLAKFRNNIRQQSVSKDDDSESEADDHDPDVHRYIPKDVVEELAKSAKKRMVAKGGKVNVRPKNLPDMRTLFLKDYFNSALDAPWSYLAGLFALSFLLTWTVFAVLWWLICYFHGDFEPDNLPDGKNQGDGSHIPCVLATWNFASAYLFSVETQHTIGYGSRQTTEECWHAIVLMSIQSIMGVFCSSAVAGIVFAKLAMPKNRSHTILFSKNALISMRNGFLYLIFRVDNIRKSHLIESHIRVQIVLDKEVTAEGEVSCFTQRELKCSTMEAEDDEDRMMMLLPTTIFHKIDEDSPFFEMTPKDILQSRFEMIVCLEGIIESTGNTVQTRTSYLPREVLWGYRFENMILYNHKSKQYEVDVSYLNAFEPDEKTPQKSMKTILEEREEQKRKEDAANKILKKWRLGNKAAEKAAAKPDEE